MQHATLSYVAAVAHTESRRREAAMRPPVQAASERPWRRLLAARPSPRRRHGGQVLALATWRGAPHH